MTEVFAKLYVNLDQRYRFEVRLEREQAERLGFVILRGVFRETKVEAMRDAVSVLRLLGAKPVWKQTKG